MARTVRRSEIKKSRLFDWTGTFHTMMKKNVTREPHVEEVEASGGKKMNE
jgi:hypothetical protein